MRDVMLRQLFGYFATTPHVVSAAPSLDELSPFYSQLFGDLPGLERKLLHHIVENNLSKPLSDTVSFKELDWARACRKKPNAMRSAWSRLVKRGVLRPATDAEVGPDEKADGRGPVHYTIINPGFEEWARFRYFSAQHHDLNAPPPDACSTPHSEYACPLIAAY